MELLDCALIGVCAVIRSNTVIQILCNGVNTIFFQSNRERDRQTERDRDRERQLEREIERDREWKYIAKYKTETKTGMDQFSINLCHAE